MKSGYWGDRGVDRGQLMANQDSDEHLLKDAEVYYEENAAYV